MIGLSNSNGREQLSVFSFAGGNFHCYCMHWNDWIFRFSHVRSKLLIINLIQSVESFRSKRSRLKRFRSLPCACRFWVRPGLTSALWNNIQEGLATGEKEQMFANVSHVECVNQIKLETISSPAFSLFLMARLKEIGQLLLSLFFFLDQTKSKSKMFLPRSCYSLVYNTDI